MPYCTIDDIIASIPNANIIQLTDDEGEGEAMQDFVNEAIGYADSLIDGYLKGRYALPLSPVPTLIKKISIDLAIFHIYSRRFELDMPETMMQRYKNTIKLLEQMQKGIISIGIEEPDTGPGYYKTNKTAEDRIFSMDNFKPF